MYAGRLLGAGTFLVLYYTISEDFALRYAIGIIALLQLCSIYISKKIIAEGNLLSPEESVIDSKVLSEVAEKLV